MVFDKALRTFLFHAGPIGGAVSDEFGHRQGRMKTHIKNKRLLPTLAFAACLLASLSGCKNEKTTQSTVEAVATPAATQEQTPETDVATPSDGSVVTDIFGDTKGGEYWFGRTFRLGGRRYHVGFAFSPPGPTSEQTPDQAAVSDGLVSVSQATYALTGSEWKKVATAKDFARFGANDQAPVVEANGSVAEFAANADRYLLAVPAWHTEMGGVEMHSAEIFAFDAASSAWKYLGSLYTGENDNAGCDAGKTVSGAACTASTGELSFASNDGAGFPDISVVRSGTTLGNDGKARALGAADAIGYTYSASSGAYAQSQK